MEFSSLCLCSIILLPLQLTISHTCFSVSRIEARCEESDMNLQLDVNTELYPIRVGDKFRTVLAETLNEDGSTVTSYFPEVI